VPKGRADAVSGRYRSPDLGCVERILAIAALRTRFSAPLAGPLRSSTRTLEALDVLLSGTRHIASPRRGFLLAGDRRDAVGDEDPHPHLWGD
jgi:hypothetical protein